MQSCVGELAACLSLSLWSPRAWTNSFFVAVVASPTDAMRFARNMLQIASDCPVGEIGKRRLKRALHKAQDVCHLEVQLKGFGSWQPACTVPESLLSKYFASPADKNIRHRSLPPQVCFATAFLPHLVDCYIASLEPWCLQERATDREQKAEVLGRYATWTSSAEDLSGFMEFCAAKARERVQDAQGDRRSSCCQNRRVLAGCDAFRTSHYGQWTPSRAPFAKDLLWMCTSAMEQRVFRSVITSARRCCTECLKP